MGKMHLSEAINYQRDIEPHFFLQIFAGVGSGKNFFIEKMMMGELEGCPRQTVLLITSRKAKVSETLSQYQKKPADGTTSADNTTPLYLDANDIKVTSKIGKNGNMKQQIANADDPTEYNSYERVLKGEWGTQRPIYERSVVCTGAYVEKYIQNVYQPNYPSTHLWELFDVIVVDEVHSVVMDATYQTAPFAIRAFVNEVLSRARTVDRKAHPRFCKHLILMTGTPGPIEGLNTPSLHTLDCLSECINVGPKNIFFIRQAEVASLLHDKITNGEKVVYFTNHVPDPDKIAKDANIDPEQIAISFSDEERRKNLETSNNVVFQRMENAERSLRTECLLPADIHLFISTSRNKEGINIKNDDYTTMIIETHNRSDAVQMTGRIRKGVDNLYIVVNSTGYSTPGWETDSEFTQEKIASTTKRQGKIRAMGVANDFFAEKYPDIFLNPAAEISSKDLPRVKELIEYIQNKFPFARYNYFQNCFQYYSLRETGYKYQEDSENIFAKAATANPPYKALVSTWFPDATIHTFVSPEEQSRPLWDEMLQQYGTDAIPESAVDTLKDALNHIWGEKKKTINSLLGLFIDKRLERIGHSSDRSNYKLFRVVDAPPKNAPEGENSSS